ncbi:hypothetical protein K493DRAFT_308343 [Basidiobolus meristosporus CBS 931.73]|uniref:Uncharacterized protein n=1 Tax=Basidiobolus meristosporus CBS 931.73 TaxID=1314790 RepID=A0A1Y1X418_9FUNG|nr:hypothetical protein K493DRAFT_308343 [Basidiobolus meristosporus CBS 931.73]|eukprot:ORX80395.1 hypothetical protein K493DRAFT_308343 [Basidiobolus meristosporus CBS 931.73]
MQRTFRILSALVFLFGASYASPIATYDNQQVDQGIPVNFDGNTDNEPFSAIYTNILSTRVPKRLSIVGQCEDEFRTERSGTFQPESVRPGAASRSNIVPTICTDICAIVYSRRG